MCDRLIATERAAARLCNSEQLAKVVYRALRADHDRLVAQRLT